MKKYIKIIIGIIVFILIIVIAKIEYDELTKSYKPEEITQEETTKTLQKAKDFVVTNENGEEIKLSQKIGKPIIVNFWASWCGPCKAELPEFNEAYKENKENIEFLMVNLTGEYGETKEKVTEFIKQNKYEFPVYFDTKYSAVNTYNLSSIPQTLFIDKDGNIIKSYVGMINKNTIQKYIKELNGG